MGCRAHRKNAEALNQGSLATGFCRVPIFSISIVTLSPGLNQRGGFCAMPTLCGVPVRMTVPGNRVVLPLAQAGGSGNE
jgi:hypothetical protein